MTAIRVATCVPLQQWTVAGKLAWLEQALARTPCELFLLSQEFFGGGSCREICRANNITTDDVPVSEQWLTSQIGGLAFKFKTCIGVGATVRRDGINTEDYLYYSSAGDLLGYHSKIALPVQDSLLTGGASEVMPEPDLFKAATPVEIPELGLRVGTVFCWQVFFDLFWTALKANGTNLVVHPIKFAPRAWYKKGLNPAGRPTRVGFTQNSSSSDENDDSLGWIRKLKYESEFKDLPIAVTCNTWSGGEKYLAMCGFVDEVSRTTKLHNIKSLAENDYIHVHTYDPSLYGELSHLSLAVYAQFKDIWQELMEGTMRRKATRIEQRTFTGRDEAKQQPSAFDNL